MMERFQDAEFSWHCCPQKTVTIPRSAYACCTYYSPNPRLSVLFTHPTPVSPCLAQNMRVSIQGRIQDFSDGGAHTWFWKCDVTKTTFFLLAGVEAMFVHAQNLVALDSNEPRYNSRRGSTRRCAPSLDPPLLLYCYVLWFDDNVTGQ